MASNQNNFHRTASCYGSISILDGVPFKVGEKFKPPKKVTLPVGWHKKDPSDVLNRTYNFSLEKYVLAKCEEEKKVKELEESQLRDQEALEAAVTFSSSTTSSQPEGKTNTTPIYANVGLDILTPVTVGTTNSSTSKQETAGSDNFNIKEFEGDSMTPFELVELQSINNMDALKSLLQPELESTVVTQPSPAPVNMNTVASTASSHPQLIDINTETSYISKPPRKSPSPSGSNTGPADFMTGSSHCHKTPATCSGPDVNFSIPRSSPTVSFSTRDNNVLIDVRNNKPLTHPSPSETVNPLAKPPLGGLPSAVPHLPPIVGAGTRLPPPRPSPPQIPPRTYKNSMDSQKNLTREELLHSASQSITPVSLSGSLGSGFGQNHQGVERAARGYSPPQVGLETVANTSQWAAGDSSGKRRIGERRTRLCDGTDGQVTNVHLHSSPLPPIPNASNDAVVQESSVSKLPNPLPSMSSSQKSFVASVSCMGFPEARVARAVLRLGEKEKEVIDFLIMVEEFSSNGYCGDSIEVALIEYEDKEKVLDFLKAATMLSELGFKNEDIHEALKKTNNDTDKALDYLMAK